MNALTSLLLLLATAAGVHWLRGSLHSLRETRAPGLARTVSVVVPARDEEARLPVLLASLARLDPAPAEVVVVDDGSRDATARIAREAGATVLTLHGPPSGWTGKAWACHQGASAARGDLLLFLDADTELEPGALGGLLTTYAARPQGLLSVQPFHVVRRGYEQLSAYFNAVSLLASGGFGARPPRRPMAFGPVLLTSKADWVAAGTHAAVRAEVLDDVALARAYDRVGLPVRCLVGGRAARMRMYPAGPRQLIEGWTKNFASGAAATSPLPAAAVTGWVAAHHAVAVGALTWLVGLLSGAPADPDVPTSVVATAWVLAWAGVAAQLRSVLRRIGSFAWWTWLLFPVTLLAFDLVFARSVLLTGVRGSVRWRGRAVPTGLGRLRTEDH
ncbi:glycosyltransferase [Nocardioides flavescens]|uniref:glycosyltransferase n=1 Tax=Nocardioides flavescens TaxID=2691959 RepID=UPI00136AB61B